MPYSPASCVETGSTFGWFRAIGWTTCAMDRATAHPAPPLSLIASAPLVLVRSDPTRVDSAGDSYAWVGWPTKRGHGQPMARWASRPIEEAESPHILLGKDPERQREIDRQHAREYAAGEFAEVASFLGGEGANTTHCTVIDAEGSIVSATQTAQSAFGAKVTAPGTGMILDRLEHRAVRVSERLDTLLDEPFGHVVERDLCARERFERPVCAREVFEDPLRPDAAVVRPRPRYRPGGVSPGPRSAPGRAPADRPVLDRPARGRSA